MKRAVMESESSEREREERLREEMSRKSSEKSLTFIKLLLLDFKLCLIENAIFIWLHYIYRHKTIIMCSILYSVNKHVGGKHVY